MYAHRQTYTHIYTHIYIYIHTLKYTRIHLHIHPHFCLSYTHTHTLTHKFTHAQTYALAHKFIYAQTRTYTHSQYLRDHVDHPVNKIAADKTLTNLRPYEFMYYPYDNGTAMATATDTAHNTQSRLIIVIALVIVPSGGHGLRPLPSHPFSLI